MGKTIDEEKKTSKEKKILIKDVKGTPFDENTLSWSQMEWV